MKFGLLAFLFSLGVFNPSAFPQQCALNPATPVAFNLGQDVIAPNGVITIDASVEGVGFDSEDAFWMGMSGKKTLRIQIRNGKEEIVAQATKNLRLAGGDPVRVVSQDLSSGMIELSEGDYKVLISVRQPVSRANPVSCVEQETILTFKVKTPAVRPISGSRAR